MTTANRTPRKRRSGSGKLLVILGAVAALSFALAAPTSATSEFPIAKTATPKPAPASGGTSIMIHGRNFTGATAVNFGSTPAASFRVESATSITAITPAHPAGPAPVTVTTPQGTSRPHSFQFMPVVSAVSPNVGPTAGGTIVTITGAGFAPGVTSFKFGKTAATIRNCVSQTTCEVVAPAHKQETVSVRAVVNHVKQREAGATFTYELPPVLSSVIPNEGPLSGGTSVVITGENLNAIAVKFGSTSASSFTVQSSTSITAVSPAGTAGTVDVTVQNAARSTSAIRSGDEFTYRRRPAVSEVSPKIGPEAGGTSVTITGTDFTGATAVRFGSNPAASFNVTTAQSITAISPPGTGAVDVTVSTAGGTSEARLEDQFGYVP
jgi:IPT/TIG domain